MYFEEIRSKKMIDFALIHSTYSLQSIGFMLAPEVSCGFAVLKG